MELIRTHFEGKNSGPDPPIIPSFPVPSHEDPCFSCFVESEAAGVSTLQVLNIFEHMALLDIYNS